VPRLNVLFAVSECVPFAKTGGLGDVAGALPVELALRGHDVRLVLPRYRATKAHPARRLEAPLAVDVGGEQRWAAVWEARLPAGDGGAAATVYFLEHDVLFDRDGIYGDDRGDFGDNALRYAFLSRGALCLCEQLGFEPDVIHVHDWQTSLLPGFVKRDGGPATVLSIHNLGYQGRFGADQLGALGLSRADAVQLGFEYFGAVNLLKGGVLSATSLSTVSPRYALEIQTPEGGFGLDGVLRARAGDLVGILNGIDDISWDPSRDALLPATYDAEHLEGKAACKAALQRRLGLPLRPDVPLVGMVTRLTWQKGIDAFAAALDRLLALDLQFAVLGAGERWAEELFARLSRQTDRFRAHIGYDETLAHGIEAGADLFVMPSRYEPCGLNQLYSQRYGTLPVVRAVGGLRDTVEHGVSGFVFEQLSGDALAMTVAYGADVYRERPEEFRAMQRAAMRKKMGWDRAAAHYEALYRLAIAKHQGRY
jgi:starch synthase